MATITKVQLRDRVARHLKIKAKDLELDAADADAIDDAIDDARAELIEKGLCWWGEDAIPQSCVFALKLIVSSQYCMSGGKAGQGYEPGDADGCVRLATLKPPADINPVRVSYF